MESMSYILFVCIAVPVGLMLLPIERKSRKVVLALLMGMFCCLFVSEVNGLLLRVTKSTTLYFTTNVTPITEEIVKILPVSYYAVVFMDKKKAITKENRISIVTIAFAIGVGFAMLENVIILIRHINTVNMFFAIIRGFSTGVMHSICTCLIANFIPYIYTNKKLYYCGTLCTFNLAVVFHSVFNLLVEADSGVANNIGYMLPIIVYLILNLFVLKSFSSYRKRKRTANTEAAAKGNSDFSPASDTEADKTNIAEKSEASGFQTDESKANTELQSVSKNESATKA